MTDTAASPGCWVLDLDGVIWLGDEPIAGSAAAIARLRAAGARVGFFTNNSFSSHRDLMAKFERHGIAVQDEELFSSAEAAAGLLEPGERAFVLGGQGIVEALGKRGVDVVAEPGGDHLDAVVVGLDLNLTFDRLTTAVRAVTRGARLVGTNEDATYPTPDGPWPGGGSLIAAVAYASGTTAVVAGKPHQPAVELVTSRLGHVDVMVGDRPSTDGVFGHRLGATYALVRSGVTRPGVQPEDPTAELDEADLATIVDVALGAAATGTSREHR